nr:hypothetical protein [Streptomyces sp. SID5476]
MQFQAEGPVVEGEWAIQDTAQDRYKEWVGLYGTGLAVVIQLIEETDAASACTGSGPPRARSRARRADRPGVPARCGSI